jgi:hypothetical protein
MMWNVLFCPELPGPFAPVSRGWGNPWVIFDWDNLFGAYQLSLDAKELAYSQVYRETFQKASRRVDSGIGHCIHRSSQAC